VSDPFLKKDWYNLKAPNQFAVRSFGKTLVTKTIGTKIASDGLKGRIVDVSLGDLNKDEELSYRKIKLQIQEVQGDECLTSFYGMDLTRDKLCSLIKKWQTTIEAYVDVKTTDGYVLRMFCIGFTKRRDNQVSKTTYAKSSQIRAIRKRMVDIMSAEAAKGDLNDLVKKLIPEVIGQDIEKQCQGIFPLYNVYVRKVKLIKAPKFDMAKFMDLHTGTADAGLTVDREPAVAELEGSGGRL
jgi:small subunit ribosomal protein S3Ae